MREDLPETICCSAIYYNDGIPRVHMPRNIHTGIVTCGLRHNNCYAVMAAIFPNREYITGGVKTEQGFLTSKNRFVSRQEAADIAFKCGQIAAWHHDGIMSEDLW